MQFADSEKFKRMVSIVKSPDNRFSVPYKYYIMQCCMGDGSYDRGSQPFQDVDRLFGLRDAVAHKKPQFLLATYSGGQMDLEAKSSSIEKKLADLNILAPPPSPNTLDGFIRRIATREAAGWACGTAGRAIEDLSNRFTVDYPGVHLHGQVTGYSSALLKILNRSNNTKATYS